MTGLSLCMYNNMNKSPGHLHVKPAVAARPGSSRPTVFVLTLKPEGIWSSVAIDSAAYRHLLCIVQHSSQRL